MLAWDERQRLVDLPRYQELDRQLAATPNPEPGTV
jgi:hypothetical protein